MDDFKVLSYEEEKKLTLSEKKEYYKNLREYLKSKKSTQVKKLYLGFCEKINGSFIRSVIDKIKGYKLYIEGAENIPDNTPVIYASTHQDYNDHFNVVLSIPDHAIILNTTTVTPLFKFLLGFNGIEYVDRTSSESRFNSKMNLMEYLSKGKSVVIFPEGTFNCSPNELVLPIHSGVIDMAKKMNVPIVPLIQEYKYDPNSSNYKKNVIECHVKFGKPIYVAPEDCLDENNNESFEAKKEELVEQFASIRYELMERKGMFERKKTSIKEYINFVLARYKTWKSCNVDIDEERKTIKGFADEKYLFTYINDVKYDENNEYVKKEEQQKVEELFEKNFPKNLNNTDEMFNNQDTQIKSR